MSGRPPASTHRPPDHDRIRLTYDTVSIDVGCRDTPTLAWLVEFLAPAFQLGHSDAGDPDHLVLLETAPARHAELGDARASAAIEVRDVFTNDGEFTRQRSWLGDDGRIWAHDEAWDTFYGVDERARSVLLVSARPGAHSRLALMRVVRELATIAQHRSARLPVHGSAFVQDGSAVLICGPRRSGKTSLLIHALRCGGAFLSNDRLFVSPEAPVAARPMPTIVTIRDGTLEMFDPFKEAYESARFDRARTISECASGFVPPEVRAGRPVGISPAQLCRLLGVSMQPVISVGRILFSRIDPSVDGILIDPLAPARAREAMERSLLKPSHPTRHSQLFAPRSGSEEVAPALEAERCRRLVEQVPVYSCRLGSNAYQGDIGEALRRVDGR